VSADPDGTVLHLPLRVERWKPGETTGDAARFASDVSRMLRAHQIEHEAIWIDRVPAVLTNKVEVRLRVDLRRGTARFEWTVSAALNESQLMEAVEILFHNLPA
jgi:hypothetical protein